MCLPDTTVRMTVCTVRAVIQTVVSLKLHAMSMRPYMTVWMTARTVRTVIRTIVSCFLTRASMGKSNYYDKIKWQDSIKVIITQNYTKLETENFTICWMECPLSKWLKISKSKIWPKIGWYDGSDDRRRIIITYFSSDEWGIPMNYWPSFKPTHDQTPKWIS